VLAANSRFASPFWVNVRAIAFWKTPSLQRLKGNEAGPLMKIRLAGAVP
jgi:hypothetical protein